MWGLRLAITESCDDFNANPQQSWVDFLGCIWKLSFSSNLLVNPRIKLERRLACMYNNNKKLSARRLLTNVWKHCNVAEAKILWNKMHQNSPPKVHEPWILIWKPVFCHLFWLKHTLRDEVQILLFVRKSNSLQLLTNALKCLKTQDSTIGFHSGSQPGWEECLLKRDPTPSVWGANSCWPCLETLQRSRKSNHNVTDSFVTRWLCRSLSVSEAKLSKMLLICWIQYQLQFVFLFIESSA